MTSLSSVVGTVASLFGVLVLLLTFRGKLLWSWCIVGVDLVVVPEVGKAVVGLLVAGRF